MGFDIQTNLNALTVFLAGIVSFFSPCVLPLLPMYFGYLSGGTKRDADGTVHYDRLRVFVNTIFFVFGIGFAFSVLGLGMTALGRFLRGNTAVFTRVGGVLVLLFGIWQLLSWLRDTGILHTEESTVSYDVPGANTGRLQIMVARLRTFLATERRLPIHFENISMSPLSALLFGFVFSFAWTPCIGPTLSSVLVMAATAGSNMHGFLYIALYTLGFVLPFLAVGLFTQAILEKLKRHRNIARIAMALGALLLILMGIGMLTGGVNHLSSYLAQRSGSIETTEQAAGENSVASAGAADGSSADGSAAATTGQAASAGTENASGTDSSTSTESPAIGDVIASHEENEGEVTVEDPETAKVQLLPAVDFTLHDQYGETHSLSGYRGKTVFLNFWATWCNPCVAEMPDIQKLYEEFESGVNADDDPDNDVVILGIAAPDYGAETSEEGIKAFLEDHDITYPVLMDPAADEDLYLDYYITAFPTTYMIDRDGNVFGYITGSMSEDVMRQIIDQTQKGRGGAIH
ncbi:cytochrome c-type biogenesis protein [Lachnospiraceae bacterium NK3A20]|nr:cytochrome c-type biogenesis protein [Lachnospiraceae bacterium NK3A20]